MPTGESQQILAAAKMVFNQLSISDQALVSEAQRLKLKGNRDLAEITLIENARKVLSGLPKTSRDVLENAARVRNAQIISLTDDSSEKSGTVRTLRVERAKLGPIPDKSSGLLAVLFIAMFVAFFSIGPGVCVWLALSELMPTRIRSAGMGIRRKLRFLCHVPVLGCLYGDLFHHCCILSTRNKRQIA